MFVNSFFEITKNNLNIDNKTSGELLIINSLGKTILRKEKSSQKITLDLKEIDSGLYLIKIEGHTTKLIVQ